MHIGTCRHRYQNLKQSWYNEKVVGGKDDQGRKQAQRDRAGNFPLDKRKSGEIWFLTSNKLTTALGDIL